MTLAWHFVAKDRRLNHGDGRVVHKGQTLRVEPPIVPCERGLHASVDVIDALSYADGHQVVVCRVRVGGEIVDAGDKLAASERTCLWWVDAEMVLHEFAVWCARRALKRAKVTDPRSWAAPDCKLRWLRGEATDEDLAAAGDAAWAAAWAAAGDAAWDAARAAAGAAAWAAAGDAAWDAAWDAARAAERKAQSRKLVSMLKAARKR